MNTFKRISLVALAMCILIPAANAQIRFGVKAGLNLNNIDFNEKITSQDFSTDNSAGFTVGVMGEFMIPVVNFGIDASLMYTYMGAEKKDGNAVVESPWKDISSPRNYFEVPVNLKYKFGMIPIVNRFLKPYVFTGPSFAFKLGGNDDKFETNTFQCAWNLGLGLEFFNHLQVQGSYAWGINNIIKEMKVAGIVVNDNIKAYNNYWTISAAWLF